MSLPLLTGNPFVTAWRTRRRHQREQRPLTARLVGLALPFAAAGILVVLVRQLFLSFLDLSPEVWPDGVTGISLRGGVLVIGLLAIDLYGAIVRGSDRAVLEIHPVDPGKVVWYETLRVAVERWWVVPLCALLLSPIALEGAPLLWLGGTTVLAGSAAVGLTGGALVNLLAIQISEDEQWAGFLDLIRGGNPRPQAAFIYAPGVALAGAGTVTLAAAEGLRIAADGHTLGLAALALPFAASALIAPAITPLAHKTWFRASVVIAEINARYAGLMDAEASRRVYLDWTVRFLPSPTSRYALKDLRHGWRARRFWITAAWLLGTAALAAGWSTVAHAPLRAATIAIGGVFACGAIGVLLEQDEPPFLRVWLPSGGFSRFIARALVLTAWLQPLFWLPTAMVWLMHGPAALEVAGVLALSILLAVTTAVLSSQLRERALAAYVPVSAILGALMLGVLQ